nr:DoxX family protein [uncultured Flavobacterium sp.]
MIKPKNIKVLYIILLSLLAFFFAFSGFLEITKNPITYPKTLKMGYPPYFITSLGIFKICGAIILLLPNFKKLKEWAFAGFTFDVIFAFISGLAINSFEDLIKSSFAFFIIIGTYFLFLENTKTIKI